MPVQIFHSSMILQSYFDFKVSAGVVPISLILTLWHCAVACNGFVTDVIEVVIIHTCSCQLWKCSCHTMINILDELYAVYLPNFIFISYTSNRRI